MSSEEYDKDPKWLAVVMFLLPMIGIILLAMYIGV